MTCGTNSQLRLTWLLCKVLGAGREPILTLNRWSTGLPVLRVLVAALVGCSFSSSGCWWELHRRRGRCLPADRAGGWDVDSLLLLGAIVLCTASILQNWRYEFRDMYER